MSLQNNLIKKAVIPMGGLGTRLFPATTVIPKELFPINNKPLIHLIIEEIVDAGIKDVIFILSKNKQSIYEYFNDIEKKILQQSSKNKTFKELNNVFNISKNINIQIVYQDEPLGLGHAIWCAKKLVKNDDFAVLLPDDIIFSQTSNCLKDMIKIYNEKQSSVIATCCVKLKDVSKYGILSTNDTNKKIFKINRIVEKPNPENAPSTLAVAGRYILNSNIFKYLSEFSKGAGGEIQLTDAISKSIDDNHEFYGYLFDGERIDCGVDIGLIKAHICYGLADNNIKYELFNYIKDKISEIDKLEEN